MGGSQCSDTPWKHQGVRGEGGPPVLPQHVGFQDPSSPGNVGLERGGWGDCEDTSSSGDVGLEGEV